jgi:RHS repeat-associated protein
MAKYVARKPRNSKRKNQKRIISPFSFFDQPLIAVGKKATKEETDEFVKTMAKFLLECSSGDDFTIIENYLASNPKSCWSASLNFTLGYKYLNTGFISKAINAFEKAWLLAQNFKDRDIKTMADQAFAKLINIETRLGNIERSSKLFDDFKGRALIGSSSELIIQAKELHDFMLQSPERAFRCGAFAIGAMARLQNIESEFISIIKQSRATKEGMSLSQLFDLSGKIGLDIKMIKRKKGSPVPFPSIVHWKLNHYATIREESDGQYLVEDLVFSYSKNQWMSIEAIEEEASGYFLTLKTKPDDWQEISYDEGSSVWGKGRCDGPADESPTKYDCKVNCDQNCAGMPVYNVHATVVSLNIQDIPLGYQPPRGAAINFKLTYNQRDKKDTELAYFVNSNVDHKWTCSWISYLKGMDVRDNAQHGSIELFDDEGGIIVFRFIRPFISEVDASSGLVLRMINETTFELTDVNGWVKVFSTPGMGPVDENDGGDENLLLQVWNYVTNFPNTIVSTIHPLTAIHTTSAPPSDSPPIIYVGGGGGGGRPRSNRLYLTSIEDPTRKNKVIFNYKYIWSGGNNAIRLKSVEDALGLETTLIYEASDNPLRITGVQDPFGRSKIVLKYFEEPHLPHDGLLKAITDVGGNKSSFEYNGNIDLSLGISNDFITLMQTPYRGGDAFCVTTFEGNVPGYKLEGTGIEWLRNLRINVQIPWTNAEGRHFTDQSEFIGIPKDPIPPDPIHGINAINTEILDFFHAEENLPEPQAYPHGSGMNVPNGLSGINDDAHTYLHFRNTFYWDRKAFNFNGSPAIDLSNAKIYHFLHSYNPNELGNNLDKYSRILESFKNPNESRIWFLYKGQNKKSWTAEGIETYSPAKIARVINDKGALQIFSYDYDNELKLTTKYSDALGTLSSAHSWQSSPRIKEFVYDSENKRLLKEIRQTNSYEINDTLLKIEYDSSFPTLPETVYVGGIERANFHYNDFGQVKEFAKRSDLPMEDHILYDYDDDGYLRQITNGNLTTRLTYATRNGQNINKPQSITDPNGIYTEFEYDDPFFRITKIKYFEKVAEKQQLYATEEFHYDRMDLSSYKDRNGNTTHFFYNKLHQLEQVQDAMGNNTFYEWCFCGSIQKITDANNNITKFDYDVQGRLIKKTYANNDTEEFAYDLTGRLIKKTISHVASSVQINKNYFYSKMIGIGNYFLYDDNLLQITYTDELDHRLPTPSVEYTYDQYYNRLTEVKENYNTTNFDYVGYGENGAFQIESIRGSALFRYTYDSIFRLQTMSAKINVGGFGEVEMMRELFYASNNKGWNEYNDLGEFVHNFPTASSILGNIIYSTDADHKIFETSFTPNNKNLLNSIINTNSNGEPISKHSYEEYDNNGNIKKWHQEKANPITNRLLTIGYDQLNQITSLTGTREGSQHFDYDSAGNKILNSSHTRGVRNIYHSFNFAPNNVNQIQSVAEYRRIGATTTQLLGLSLDYSANGCLTDGINKRLEWDAENRLTVIHYLSTPNEKTVFAYDAFGRRVKIIEYNADGSVVDTKQYIWNGTQICMEIQIDSHNTIVRIRKYFPQGFSELKEGQTKNYYYTKDHLGSIQEVINEEGAVVNSYSYDVWGKRTRLHSTVAAGTNIPSVPFGFTGHFYHEKSGLYLTLFRVYDPSLGRWLSRDPLGEVAGLNLYAYCGNNPVRFIDKYGLETTIIITYDYTIGSHAALHIQSPSINFLYDPAGSYGEPGRGSGDFLENVSLNDYVKYQKGTGSDVELFRFNTTPEEEKEIENRLIGNGGDDLDRPYLSVAPPFCAVNVTNAIRGIGPFKNIDHFFFPGHLANNLRDLLATPYNWEWEYITF